MAMEPPVDGKKPSERSMSSSSSASSNRKKGRRRRRGNRTSTGSGSSSGDITPQSGTRSSSSNRDRHRSLSRQRGADRQQSSHQSNDCGREERGQSTYQQTAETNDKGVFIVATDTGHERMRKVSMLSLHDPMDNKYSEENGTLLTACSSPKFDETSTSNDSAHPAEPEQNEEDDEISYVLEDLQSTNGSNDDNHVQRPKFLRKRSKNELQNQECSSHDRLFFRPSASGKFVPPKALHSDETLRRRRTRSLDGNECLVELEFQAPDLHQSTQAGGLSSAVVGVGAMDVKSHSQADQDVTKLTRGQIHRRGMEVRGIISPTPKHKQLMRKVSALGMEDPVYGNISEQVTPRHASNIFDDMDFADVPDDMKDMLTLASDRTDVVGLDDDILDSPQRKTTDFPRGSAAKQGSAPGVAAAFRNSCSSLPLLGLVPEAQTNSRKAGAVCASPSVQFQQKKTTQIPPRSTNGGQAADTNTGNVLSSASPSHALKPPYVPPEGSFYNKKRPGKNRSNSSSTLLHDDHLAAQIDALFQNSMPVLNTNCLHNSASSLDDSFNTTKSNEYNRAYVPPLSQMQGHKSTKAQKHRVLPSVDSIFPSSSGQNDKRGAIARPRGSQKGAAKINAPRTVVKIGNASAQKGQERSSKSIETDKKMEMDNAGQGKTSGNVIFIPADVKIGGYEPLSKVSGQSDYAIKGSPPILSKAHDQKPAVNKSKGAAALATKVVKGSKVSGGKVVRAIANKLAEGNGFPLR